MMLEVSTWALDSFIQGLRDWQTLIGAFLGGVLGVVGALIVSAGDRSRSERSAAYVVILDLSEFCSWAVTLQESWKREKAAHLNRDIWYAEQLTNHFVSISPTFEQSMAVIGPNDNFMAGHLGLFLKGYKMLAPARERLVLALSPMPPSSHVSSAFVMARATQENDARFLTDAFLNAAAHASCAKDLVELLVMQRRWWRPKRRKPYCDKCMSLLKNGELADLDEPLTRYGRRAGGA